MGNECCAPFPSWPRYSQLQSQNRRKSPQNAAGLCQQASWGEPHVFGPSPTMYMHALALSNFPRATVPRLQQAACAAAKAFCALQLPLPGLGGAGELMQHHGGTRCFTNTHDAAHPLPGPHRTQDKPGVCRAQPTSHSQHEGGEVRVTITTSATTSPRGNGHLTLTYTALEAERTVSGVK